MKYEKLTMNISSILSCDKRLNLINTNIKISKSMLMVAQDRVKN